MKESAGPPDSFPKSFPASLWHKDCGRKLLAQVHPSLIGLASLFPTFGDLAAVSQGASK